MARIKMRLNKDEDAICTCCKNGRDLSLDMYDVKIGNVYFTICDTCNEMLLAKSLRASCLTNGRLKSKEDIAIIKRRGRSKYEI
jgi:hypothetical protein